jgi:hypothetical protein
MKCKKHRWIGWWCPLCYVERKRKKGRKMTEPKCPLPVLELFGMYEPVCEPFQAKNAPDQIPAHDAWSYLMMHDDGRPFAWHTLGRTYSQEVADEDGMGEVWYSLYRKVADCAVRKMTCAPWLCPCKKFEPQGNEATEGGKRETSRTS